jgi:hypothetical protein
VDFTQVVVAMFGRGLEILVDEFSSKKQSSIEMYAECFADVGLLHSLNHCVSTDSALQ